MLLLKMLLKGISGKVFKFLAGCARLIVASQTWPKIINFTEGFV
jgi:hypothetical protein